MRKIATLTLVLGTLGCSSPTAPEGAVFRVEKSSYAPGETALATLMNLSTEPLGYSFCNAPLQRREGSGWQTVEEPLMVCTLELAVLGPGDRVTYDRGLPDGLAAGTYRLQASVDREGPSAWISTQAFEVP